MGREIRRVAPDWCHPTRPGIGHIPLFKGSYRVASAQYQSWLDGSHPDYRCDWTADEYFGSRPRPEGYMPDWPEGAATAYQVYENVTEGTPISPVLQTRDDLYHWLTQVGDGMGIGGRKLGLTPDQAKRFMADAWAPSMVCDAKGLRAGVER